MPEYPWAADYSLDTFKERGGVVYTGTDAMEAIMKKATPGDPVYIVEIAPANSLGDVLLRGSGEIANNCICVAMSGSVYRGYMNGSSTAAEYNVVQNVTASQAMYDAKWLSPLVTAPLDTCNFDQWNGDVYQKLVVSNNSAHLFVQVLLENYQVWYDNGGKNYGGLLPFSPTTGTDVLYDAQAAWMTGQLISKSPLTPLVMKALPLMVNSAGYTIVDASGQHYPVNAALGFQTSDAHAGAMQIGAELIQSIINEN